MVSFTRPAARRLSTDQDNLSEPRSTLMSQVCNYSSPSHPPSPILFLLLFLLLLLPLPLPLPYPYPSPYPSPITPSVCVCSNYYLTLCLVYPERCWKVGRVASCTVYGQRQGKLAELESGKISRASYLQWCSLQVTKSSAQIGFIKFVLIPLFEALGQVFPVLEVSEFWSL